MALKTVYKFTEAGLGLGVSTDFPPYSIQCVEGTVSQRTMKRLWEIGVKGREGLPIVEKVEVEETTL